MDLIFKNACLADDKPLTDVLIKDGKIAQITPNSNVKGKRIIDAKGRVLLPGFIESHLHLEKALANKTPNLSGTLQEAIAVTAKLKPTFTYEDILERSRRTLRMLVKNGTTWVRAHAEFDPVQGFVGLDTVLSLKNEFKEIIDIQVVAFPQEGIFKAPGTDNMMYEAIKKGADVIGAIPYNDFSAEKHIDFVFDLAQKFNKDLDLHQDFADDADQISIEYLAQKTIDYGMQGRVSAGHMTALAALSPEKLNKIIKLLAKAKISVMCLPATDLHLGARNDAYNVRRTLTPVRALRDGGVNVVLATNNIRNAFTPFNNGDLLQITALAMPACHLGGVQDQKTLLPMITTNAALALGLKNYGIATGNDADLILLDTHKVADVILDIPDRIFVVKRGKIVVESERIIKFNF